MAVQGNLLAGSDLSRMVAAAQGNRPETLGQYADKRRAERTQAEQNLMKFAAEYGLKQADLRDKIQDRALTRDIQKLKIDNEFKYQTAMTSQRAAEVQNQIKKATNEHSIAIRNAKTTEERQKAEELYQNNQIKNKQSELAITDLYNRLRVWNDMIRVDSATGATGMGFGTTETFVDAKKGEELFNLVFGDYVTDKKYPHIKWEDGFENFFDTKPDNSENPPENDFGGVPQVGKKGS